MNATTKLRASLAAYEAGLRVRFTQAAQLPRPGHPARQIALQELRRTDRQLERQAFRIVCMVDAFLANGALADAPSGRAGGAS